MQQLRISRGFSLVELVAVIVLMSIVGALVSSRMMPSTTLQLQGGRDQVVSAFFIAQQKAMTQSAAVRLLTSTNSIDVRADVNGDGSFANSESVRAGGFNFPIELTGGVTLNAEVFDFDRLGRTESSTITISKNSASVNVNVSKSGYVY